MNELSEFKILDMANQMRMAKLAYESIVAMFQSQVNMLPVWMDEECLYWCVAEKLELHIVSTKFETKHAGQQISMITTIVGNPRTEKNIRESIDNILLLSSEELEDKMGTILAPLGIPIPDNPYNWLFEVRRSLTKR